MLNDIALYQAMASDLPPMPSEDTALTKKAKPRRHKRLPYPTKAELIVARRRVRMRRKEDDGA